jgi:hypothetical protein
MAKSSNEAQTSPAPEQPVVVGDEAMTVYGMTVGELISTTQQDVDRLLGQIKDGVETIAARDAEILRLTAALDEAKKPKVFTDAEVQAAVKLGPQGLKKLPNGDISVRVTVPEEAALPLLSWADSAGEDAEMYIQKTLAEALVAYTCS